ncbi:MAG TPA: hypothetical protein VIM55_16295 [Mucilaginibacter sp.]
MTTLTVNIDNKKSEKAVKAVLDALGLDYNIEPSKSDELNRPLNKAEQRLYDGLKRSFEQIKLHKEGKLELKDARTFLDEL